LGFALFYNQLNSKRKQISKSQVLVQCPHDETVRRTATLVFMGSPDFSLPGLRALVKAYDVVGVITQPDRASGRGRELKAPPVKTLALELGIPVMQPEKLRQPEAMEQLRAWNPDLIVVAAFGQILRKDVLELPRYGCINVHASLLPRWRGAAPINAAILLGMKRQASPSCKWMWDSIRAPC
jgi:methionyl-tRNA formyltransferase